MRVSIPYSPSRRRQWVGTAVAALLLGAMLWKPKPLAPAPVRLPASESASSFEDMLRSVSPNQTLAASSNDLSAPPAHDPK